MCFKFGLFANLMVPHIIHAGLLVKVLTQIRDFTPNPLDQSDDKLEANHLVLSY